MMEVNNTLDLTLYQELHDNVDIIHGGNGTVHGLMSCLVHSPAQYAATVREEFSKYLATVFMHQRC